MAANNANVYELYRGSSVGIALTDTLDDLISSNQIEPQLAMKILANFDKTFGDVMSDNVRARLSFKGSLETYRFCDDVWTFLVKDVNFKLDNSTLAKADKVKIVSMTNKKDIPDYPKYDEDQQMSIARGEVIGPRRVPKLEVKTEFPESYTVGAFRSQSIPDSRVKAEYSDLKAGDVFSPRVILPSNAKVDSPTSRIDIKPSKGGPYN